MPFFWSIASQRVGLPCQPTISDLDMTHLSAKFQTRTHILDVERTSNLSNFTVRNEIFKARTKSCRCMRWLHWNIWMGCKQPYIWSDFNWGHFGPPDLIVLPFDRKHAIMRAGLLLACLLLNCLSPCSPQETFSWWMFLKYSGQYIVLINTRLITNR